MESTQNLKKRLRAVGNINKITKAMELVAATKMRKSQEVALNSRPYALIVLDLLAHISRIKQSKHVLLPDLLQSRRVKKVLFVLVASDKGLAGSFNGSVFKKFEQHMERDREKYKHEEKVFAAVGEKAFAYFQRKKLPVLQKFVEAGDYTTPQQISPIANFIIEGYKTRQWDRVVVISMHFASALRQDPKVRLILPVDPENIKTTIQEIVPKTGRFSDIMQDIVSERQDTAIDYLIEPSPQVVLKDLAQHLLFIEIYHLILEANASEHSARRMAMKTASDNASDLSESLNLEYNKSRQSQITKEIIEISAGAEALS